MHVASTPVGRWIASVSPCILVVDSVRSSVCQCRDCLSVNTRAESTVGGTCSRRSNDGNSSLASIATGVYPDYEGVTSCESEGTLRVLPTVSIAIVICTQHGYVSAYRLIWIHAGAVSCGAGAHLVGGVSYNGGVGVNEVSKAVSISVHPNLWIEVECIVSV